MSENIAFVRIKEPISFRKVILGYLKDVILSLQRYEKFKWVREEKINEIYKLKNIMIEIGKLNSQLKVLLPQSEIIINMHKKEQKKDNKSHSKIIAIRQKKDSEIEKLEKELNSIESKLNSLNI